MSKIPNALSLSSSSPDPIRVRAERLLAEEYSRDSVGSKRPAWMLANDFADLTRELLTLLTDARIREVGGCQRGNHFWPDGTVDGDTCDCGAWYRFSNTIEEAPRG